MEGSVCLDKLQKLLYDMLYGAVKEKSIEELQALDWFTWEHENISCCD